MAMMKDAAMARDEIIDQVQKLVLCGRVMLDAIEALTNLCSEHFSEEGASVERPSFPDASGKRVDAQQEATLEQVRSMLAEKSRKGFRAEVKALITAHGVDRLSEIRDPAELGKLMEEATKIGAP